MINVDIFSNTHTAPFNDHGEENQYLLMLAIMWYVRYCLLFKYCKKLLELLNDSHDYTSHTKISKDIDSLHGQ